MTELQAIAAKTAFEHDSTNPTDWLVPGLQTSRPMRPAALGMLVALETKRELPLERQLVIARAIDLILKKK